MLAHLRTATNRGAYRWLTRSERGADASQPSAQARRDFRAGRVAAKRAAASLLAMDRLDRLEIAACPGAPPEVRLLDERGGGSQRTRLVVSLSDRDGRGAAMAAPAGARIGVDLERAGAVAEAHARYFLTPRERLGRTEGDLTALWALKEAAWKALRLSDATPFAALELHTNEDGALSGLSLGGVWRRARARFSEPWPGWVLAAVEVEGAAR